MWTGLVLAGGRSGRMGRDKALLRLGGETLLERAVRTVRAAGGVPVVVGSPRSGVDLPGVTFADEVVSDADRSGPLNALRHGLALSRTEVAVALACDLPLIPAALLRFLAAGAERFPAVVPVVSGVPQVLAAAYNRRFLPLAERLLEQGETSVQAFAEAVGAHLSEDADLAPFGGAAIFLNVNTPADLEAAAAALRAGAA